MARRRRRAVEAKRRTLVISAHKFTYDALALSLTTEDMAIEHLDRVFPSDEWENRLVCRQFLLHFLPLLKDVQLHRNKTLQSLGHKTGLCLRVDGRTIEMVGIFGLLVAIQGETLIHLD